MLAIKVPEMAMEESEAKLLAERIKAVEKYYPAISSIMSGKIADHVALAAVMGEVYGTRLVAIKLRMDKERATQPNNVTKFPNANA
jgi:hypothetical protein